MKQQRQRPPSMLDDAREGFNLASWALDIHAKAILVFTHTGMGIHGVGAGGWWAFLTILVYGGLTNSPGMVFVYLPAYLLMVVRHRLFPDIRQHMHYEGYPFLTGWMTSNEYIALCMEAALMIPAGSLISKLSPAAGVFVMLGTISLGARYAIAHTLHVRRVWAWRNWQAEAEQWQQAKAEAERWFGR